MYPLLGVKGYMLVHESESDNASEENLYEKRDQL